MGPRPTKLLPYGQWPDQDRVAWQAALASGDVFDDAGAAAHWAAGTRRTVLTGYRRWLQYLKSREPETLVLVPATRVMAARVELYVDMLRASITPAGVYNYVKHLYDAIRVMAPDEDWGWLQEVTRRLARHVEPRGKRHRMVDADRLLSLGLDLMERRCEDDKPLDSTIRYRDGLIIALLSARPLRRRNVAGIRLGKNLVGVGDGYALVFSAEETKNHEPLEFPWPSFLLSQLEHYLSKIRPLFLRAHDHDGLWALAKGCPMTSGAIYSQVCKRTEAAFGFPVNLQLFRDCAATTIAERDPRHVRVSRDLLGHSRLETTDRYYNHARTHHAALAYQAGIAALRRRLTRGQR